MPQIVLRNGTQTLVEIVRRGSSNTRVREINSQETFLVQTRQLLDFDLTPETPETPERQELPMADKFEAMEELVKVVCQNHSTGLFIAGPGGTGKTYTVLKVLRDLGFREGEDYIRITGHSSPLGLYNKLYENSDKLVIFDDCDNILKDNTTLNILKAVLDTYHIRSVNWNSSSSKVAIDHFEFTGRVIFISNLNPDEEKSQHLQAMLTRVLTVVCGRTREEVLERIVSLIPTIMRAANATVQEEVEAFFRENSPFIRDLSLRFLVHINSLYRYDPENWKSLALALN